MRKCATRIVQLALAGLLVSGLATAAQAETGAVRVVFTKGGFIIGVGGGRGVLTFRGAGGALAAGAGGVQLQNEKGVILQLHGAKVGVELSAAVGGVQIALE